MSQIEVPEPTSTEAVADRLEIFEYAWKKVETLTGREPDFHNALDLAMFLVRE